MSQDDKSISAEGVRSYLLKKQQDITRQIKQVELEDPVLSQTVAEASELGTEAWEADVHANKMATQQSLLISLSQIQQALEKIKNGTYGRCIICGQMIETKRLMILPTATSCQLCIAAK